MNPTQKLRTTLPLAMVALLALSLAACGGAGPSTSDGHSTDTEHAEDHGSITVVNASDLFFARVRLSAANGVVDHTNSGYATVYFTGAQYGSFTVTAYDARGYALGQVSGTLSARSKTVTFYN